MPDSHGLVRGWSSIKGGYYARYMSRPLYPRAIPGTLGSDHLRAISGKLCMICVIAQVARMLATWQAQVQRTIKITVRKPFPPWYRAIGGRYKQKSDLHGEVRSHLSVDGHVVDPPLGVWIGDLRNQSTRTHGQTNSPAKLVAFATISEHVPGQPDWLYAPPAQLPQMVVSKIIT